MTGPRLKTRTPNQTRTGLRPAFVQFLAAGLAVVVANSLLQKGDKIREPRLENPQVATRQYARSWGTGVGTPLHLAWRSGKSHARIR